MNLILALDPGKYKSVVCLYEPATAEASFQTLTTCRAELTRLFGAHAGAVVVIEACLLAGWVADLAEQLGLVCKVANTSSEAWKFKHTKRKTDRDDALRLAQLQAMNQLPTVTLPDAPTRQWRQLISFRQDLVGKKVAWQNRLRALLVGQGLPAPRGHRAWTEEGLTEIEQHARPLAECGPQDLWRGLLHQALVAWRQTCVLLAETEKKLDERGAAEEQVQRLRTIPGVGPRTAETIVAFLHQPERFASGKAVGAYAGLVPRQYQSGERDCRGRITRRGPGILRKLLVECAWVMLRYNKWAAGVYARLSRGKARKKQAIVALARKLLVRCWAMLRDKTEWRDGAARAAEDE